MLKSFVSIFDMFLCIFGKERNIILSFKVVKLISIEVKEEV